MKCDRVSKAARDTSTNPLNNKTSILYIFGSIERSQNLFVWFAKNSISHAPGPFIIQKKTESDRKDFHHFMMFCFQHTLW